uniref:MARVEL domain-containing protein n=1 Tax=Caenorhabditis tropicalis TaxID=1561998 RepID=A0A1I7TBF1_9PELO
MVDANIALLGLSICVGFIMNAIGVFTPNWVVDIYSDHIGIVPYYTYEAGFFAVASWFMFISFAFYLVILIIYLPACLQVNRNGYSVHLRTSFSIISLLSFLITIFIIVGVIMIGTNISGTGISFGYSAWLCIASAVISAFSVGSSGFIAMKLCR